MISSVILETNFFFYHPAHCHLSKNLMVIRPHGGPRIATVPTLPAKDTFPYAPTLFFLLLIKESTTLNYHQGTKLNFKCS